MKHRVRIAIRVRLDRPIQSSHEARDKIDTEMQGQISLTSPGNSVKLRRFIHCIHYGEIRHLGEATELSLAAW